jgi:hypothetical protein
VVLLHHSWLVMLLRLRLRYWVVLTLILGLMLLRWYPGKRVKSSLAISSSSAP